MIKDPTAWAEWEAQGPLRAPVDFRRNLRLMDAMYHLARTLGVLPPADPLDGLDDKIRLARILNHVRGLTDDNCPRL